MSSQQRAMEAAMKEMASEQILEGIKQQEKQLDEAIQKLDNMEEDDFEKLREKRLQQMKKKAEQRHTWKLLGHGEYSELADQAAFFECVKKSPRCIIHFYRPATRYCEKLDRIMSDCAGKHLETRLCKINAEKSPYLVEKLNIFMMPTLLLVKDSKTVHHIRGFDEFGGTDDFDMETFEYVTSNYGVLNYDGGVPEFLTGDQSKGVNSIGMKSGSIRAGLHERDYDDDEEED